LIINNSYAQILNVPEVIQEKNQWCWAGVSKCILDYYGYPVEQCQIAEYARQVITWHNFGNTDCCINPNLGCNYWNYNWSYPGSIQDILIHFGDIQNYGKGSSLSLSEISSELSSERPFVIRWGWYSGGGHFVVGHGINDNYLHYMDPWFGEGLHISSYNWVLDDGNHSWTHTNILTTNPSIITTNKLSNIAVYPNPTNGELRILMNNEQLIMNNIEVFDVYGKKLSSNHLIPISSNHLINISHLSAGVYIVKVHTETGEVIRKVVKE
jgi:hypothetical protein